MDVASAVACRKLVELLDVALESHGFKESRRRRSFDDLWERDLGWGSHIVDVTFSVDPPSRVLICPHLQCWVKVPGVTDRSIAAQSPGRLANRIDNTYRCQGAPQIARVTPEIVADTVNYGLPWLEQTLGTPAMALERLERNPLIFGEMERGRIQAALRSYMKAETASRRDQMGLTLVQGGKQD